MCLVFQHYQVISWTVPGPPADLSGCIPLLVSTCSQRRSVWAYGSVCRTASKGTTSADTSSMTLSGLSGQLSTRAGHWISSIWGPNRCLKTQLWDWGSSISVSESEGWYLMCACWSHAFLSKTIYVYVLSELCWKVIVLCIFTRGCKSYLNSCILKFFKMASFPGSASPNSQLGLNNRLSNKISCCFSAC